ncbi:MAG: DUF1611 domain-containing protein [Planctomycetota bacterium]
MADSQTTQIGGSRIVILTEGKTDPLTAKTANVLLRYRGDDIIALLDSTQAGKTAQKLLGVGGDTPIVASLGDVEQPDTLLIGVATAGGKIPAEWRALCHEAIERGMSLVSGMHQFLSDDPELVAAANRVGVSIHDVRKNDEKEVATRQDLTDDCLRILTVGQDCSVGKMVAALEIARGLQGRGVDAKFVATGQTGIMVEGDGLPIDCVISDFVNGACEKLVRQNLNREVMVVEGQATITHPRFSAVSCGLLHGVNPHGMILGYEVGRTHLRGMEHLELPTLRSVLDAYEHLASFGHPAKVIAIAMNSRKVSDGEAEAERERMRAEFGLPVADPIRHGPGELVDAVLNLRASK